MKNQLNKYHRDRFDATVFATFSTRHSLSLGYKIVLFMIISVFLLELYLRDIQVNSLAQARLRTFFSLVRLLSARWPCAICCFHFDASQWRFVYSARFQFNKLHRKQNVHRGGRLWVSAWRIIAGLFISLWNWKNCYGIKSSNNNRRRKKARAHHTTKWNKNEYSLQQ